MASHGEHWARRKPPYPPSGGSLKKKTSSRGDKTYTDHSRYVLHQSIYPSMNTEVKERQLQCAWGEAAAGQKNSDEHEKHKTKKINKEEDEEEEEEQDGLPPLRTHRATT